MHAGHTLGVTGDRNNCSLQNSLTQGAVAQSRSLHCAQCPGANGNGCQPVHENRVLGWRRSGRLWPADRWHHHPEMSARMRIRWGATHGTDIWWNLYAADVRCQVETVGNIAWSYIQELPQLFAGISPHAKVYRWCLFIAFYRSSCSSEFLRFGIYMCRVSNGVALLNKPSIIYHLGVPSESVGGIGIWEIEFRVI